MKSLFDNFSLLRHVQIGCYLKVTLATGSKSVNVPIISLFEHFPLLRNVQIRSSLKETLSYRGLMC